MVYTVYWYRFPHGIEGESMVSNCKHFTVYQKAVDFLIKRFQLINSVNWAGGYVEDENGKLMYDITDIGEIFDYTK